MTIVMLMNNKHHCVLRFHPLFTKAKCRRHHECLDLLPLQRQMDHLTPPAGILVEDSYLHEPPAKPMKKALI